MKRFALPTLAFFLVVWLGGCDTGSSLAGPEAVDLEPTMDAQASNETSRGAGTAADWLAATMESTASERVSDSEAFALERRTSSPARQEGSSIQAYPVETPQPLVVFPEKVRSATLRGGEIEPTRVPPAPCDPEAGPDDPDYCDDPGGGGGGGTGGGSGDDITELIWFSRIYPINAPGHVVSGESHSYATDEYGNPKNIDYIGVTGRLYGNGLLLDQGSAGLNNGAYAITQAYGQSSSTSTWAQNGAHTFTVPSASGPQTYNETSSDSEVW